MSIDYTALLGLTPGIQVAKGDYDVTRDGGGVGDHPINTPAVPSGSILFAYMIYTTIAFTFLTTGAATLRLANTNIDSPAAGLGAIKTALIAQGVAVVTDADRALVMAISNDTCLTGACTFWLFYLPT